MHPAHNPIGSKLRSIHIMEYSILGYSSPNEAISGAKAIHKQRMQELNLDLSDVVGKQVVNFHWDDHHLILEFENGFFLELKSENKLLHVHLIDKTDVVTSRDAIVQKIYQDGSSSIWKPGEIAQEYIGKIFIGTQLGRQDAWLYFKDMPFLIFCILMKIKESDELFLSWNESD